MEDIFNLFQSAKKISIRDNFLDNARDRLIKRINLFERYPVYNSLHEKPLPSLRFSKTSRKRLASRINHYESNKEQKVNVYKLLSLLFQKQIIAASLVFIFSFWIFSPFDTTALNESIAKTESSGVFIKHIGDSWEKINKEVIVEVGDIIKTDANSVVQVSFSDQSFIRLAESTEVKIGAFFVDNNMYNSLKLNKGKAWSNIVSLDRPFIL